MSGVGSTNNLPKGIQQEGVQDKQTDQPNQAECVQKTKPPITGLNKFKKALVKGLKVAVLPITLVAKSFVSSTSTKQYKVRQELSNDFKKQIKEASSLVGNISLKNEIIDLKNSLHAEKFIVEDKFLSNPILKTLYEEVEDKKREPFFPDAIKTLETKLENKLQQKLTSEERQLINEAKANLDGLKKMQDQIGKLENSFKGIFELKVGGFVFTYNTRDVKSPIEVFEKNLKGNIKTLSDSLTTDKYHAETKFINNPLLADIYNEVLNNKNIYPDHFKKLYRENKEPPFLPRPVQY